MGTSILIPSKESFEYESDPDTICAFCDVLAVAELLFVYATVVTEHGPKPKPVTIADVIEVTERQLYEETCSVAFKNAFIGEDGAGMNMADRQETVARACQYLVSCGWLQKGVGGEVFTPDFWDDPTRDMYITIKPSWDLVNFIRLKRESK